MAEMTKAKKNALIKTKVLESGLAGFLEENLAVQIASGSWLIEVEDIDGETRLAEVKVIAKAEDFDSGDALEEFEDKQKAAKERAEKQAAKRKAAEEKKAAKAKADAEKKAEQAE